MVNLKVVEHDTALVKSLKQTAVTALGAVAAAGVGALIAYETDSPWKD
jgi:hypothetical protein